MPKKHKDHAKKHTSLRKSKTKCIRIVNLQKDENAISALILPHGIILFTDCSISYHNVLSRLSNAERETLRPYFIQQDGYSIGYTAAKTLYNHILGNMRPVIKHLPVTIIDLEAEPAEPQKSCAGRVIEVASQTFINCAKVSNALFPCSYLLL